MALLTVGRFPMQLPLLAGCAPKSQPRPLAGELGANLCTILRTNVDFHEKTGSSESLRTVDVTDYAP